jgi:hypothetical protein
VVTKEFIGVETPLVYAPDSSTGCSMPHPLLGKLMKPKFQAHPLYLAEPNTRIVVSVLIDKNMITLTDKKKTILLTEPLDEWMLAE